MHGKAGHHGRREHEHQGVDHQKKDPERKDGKRQSEDLENEPEGSIHQSDDNRGDQCRPKTLDLESRHDMGDDHQAERA